MKNSFSRAGLACAGLAALILGHAPGAPGADGADHYIVKVKAGFQPAAVAGRHGLGPRFVYRRAANGFSAMISPERLRVLQNDPRVAAVVPDRVVRAVGKGGGNKGGGGSTGQTVPEGVKRIGAAPGQTGFTGAGVGVAIVDTGLDFAHADLQPLGGSSFDAFGGSAQDANGHGTHVGGIIAARNNTADVVGVAPDATLYAVRVLDATGSGSDATVLAGLEWVAANAASVTPPIRVVNMSLGRAGTLNDNPLLRDAVAMLHSAGISVVVAAGNDAGSEVSQQVPATYPEVMAVASTTAVNGGRNRSGYFIPSDTASYFTTDGAFDLTTGIGVTVSAPGEDREDVSNSYLIKSVGILSTRLGGGTVRLSGTSMSSPHVAGAVALLYQQAGGALNPEDARRKVMAADRVGVAPVNSPTSGYSFDGEREGVLYAPNALSQP